MRAYGIYARVVDDVSEIQRLNTPFFLSFFFFFLDCLPGPKSLPDEDDKNEACLSPGSRQGEIITLLL